MKRFIFLLCCVLLVSVSAHEPEWPLIPEQAKVFSRNDLLTGGFYFYYLNENYQAAANQLELIRHTIPRQQQGEADILEVTLLLALGLEEQAESLFQQIRPSQQGAAKAWLYLARRWQVKGKWQAVEYSAKQAYIHNAELSNEEYQEVLYLLVLSNVEQDILHTAQLYYNKLERSGYWADLARYNLLVAQIRSSVAVHSIKKTLDEVIYYTRQDEESQAILDRSYLLVALFMLDRNENKAAEILLGKVRLDSPYGGEALLFRGWSLLEQSNYYEALQPWRQLQKNYSDWHPAVIESIVAVPHTMEVMNATTQALYGYDLVEQRLQKMLDQLDEQQQDNTLQQWLASWLEQQQGDWGWRRHQLSVGSDSLTQSLMQLFSRTQFRQALGELYDTKRMLSDLSEQYKRLEQWQDMLQRRVAMLKQADGAKRLEQLKHIRANLLQQVEKLDQRWKEQGSELYPYASFGQQQNQQRLDNTVERIKALQLVNKPSRDLVPYQERWRRTRGVFLWETIYTQSARQWQSTHEFWLLYQALEDVRIQLEHSDLALSWTDSRWVGFAERLAATKQRVQTLQQQLNNVQVTQTQQLVIAMQNELEANKIRLKKYQAQARLATARLYDDALQQQLISSLESLSEEGGRHD